MHGSIHASENKFSILKMSTLHSEDSMKRFEMFIKKLNHMNLISDYHGLSSPGLTCYLNSVLQVLFMTEDFREAIKRCLIKDSTTIDPHLGRLFDDLEKSMAKTHNVTKMLGITDVYKQRDAAEYFEKILCLTSPEASKIFKGELNQKTTCLKCKERNDCRSFFWTLPLAVENSFGQIYSVEKGLKAFFKEEKVCGDNKMYCDRCNKKQNADFECEITQNPEILTLLLKRFSFDYKRRCFVKLHCEVDVPQTLRMESCMYDLYALVNHFGNLMGGHYTAQIKSFETVAWYQFDDRTVKSVKRPLFVAGKNSLRSCTAYLLMYRKVNRNPPKTDEGDQEAHFAHSDVESEGRHDEAERGDAPVPRHQLKDDSCNGGKNLKHLNGGILKKSNDDAVWKKVPNISGELEKRTNQRAASLRSRKEMLPPTDSIADGDSYRPSLQKTGTKATSVTHSSPTTNTVKLSETKGVKNKREAVADVSIEEKRIKQRREAGVRVNMGDCDVKSFHVSCNGCSSSYPHSQSLLALKEPIECNSPNLCRKSKCSSVVPADGGCKLEAAQTVTNVENTASLREKRNAKKSEGKVTKDPWK